MSPVYDIPTIKRLIVERLSAGQTLARLERTPGFPSAPTVRAWARADAGFAAELERARVLRRGVRVEQRLARGAFDAAWAAGFVAALRRGEAVGSLVGKAGQPSRGRVAAWRRAEPGFDAAVAAAVRAWRGSWRNGRRGYDEAVADRIVLARSRGATMDEIYADPALPGKAIVARWRRMVPEVDGALRIARQARWSGLAPDERVNWRLNDPVLIEAICEHIVFEAGSLRSAARCVSGAPCQATLYAWRRKHPAFARAVRLAFEQRHDMRLDAAAEALMRLEGELGVGRKPRA